MSNFAGRIIAEDIVDPPGLYIGLFGTFKLEVWGWPAPTLSRAARSVFALLALRSPRAIERGQLSDILWPDSDDTASRYNLRRTLAELRAALGPEANRLAAPTSRTLRLDLLPVKTASGVSRAICDVVTFDAAVRADVEDDRLPAALAHYAKQGALLVGERGEWVIPEREARAEAYLEARQRHANRRSASGSGPVAATATSPVSTVSRSQTTSYLPPSNLPRPVSVLMGRDRECMEVAALLRPDKDHAESRLVTLTGSGGVGKTRLALAVAEAVQPDYQYGVCFVDLAPLSDPNGLITLVAHTLKVPDDARCDDAGVLDRVLDHLRPQQALLLLDNCEHLSDSVARLALALLHLCPRLALLATSRQPLQVAGEVTWRVPGLDEGAAVRLFAARAEQANNTFRLTETNYPSVRRIAVRLDGVPLAIEMAAARMRALSVSEIATRLDDVFRALGGATGGGLPRHQTLRATLDWSYQLLSPVEQTLLARLSVFAGGWTLGAAEAVGSGDTLKEADVLDLLASLVDKSLVQFHVLEADNVNEGRYRMLETIRQYSSEKLRETEGTGATQDRHIAYFVSWVEDAQLKLEGPEQAAWLNGLDSDHDNLRAALDACASNAASPAAALSGLQLAGTLGWFWAVRGHQREGSKRIDRALEARATALETPDLTAAKVAVALAVHFSALLRSGQGEHAAAQMLYEECLVLCREIDHKRGTYMTLMMLGHAAAGQGDDARATTRFEEALSLQRETGNKRDIAITLINLGNVVARRGDEPAAKSLYEESLALNREVGDKRGIGMALKSLGSAAAQQGDDAAARILNEESLVISREIGEKNGIAATLKSLGGIAVRQGEFGVARTHYEECLGLYREIGYRIGVASTLNALGKIEVSAGDPLAAFTFYEESLREYREAGNKRGIANVLEGLAETCALGAETDARRAGVLWGAASGLRESIATPLSTDGKRERDAKIWELRKRMGDEAFAAAWTEGSALSWEQAVDHALRRGS